MNRRQLWRLPLGALLALAFLNRCKRHRGSRQPKVRRTDTGIAQPERLGSTMMPPFGRSEGPPLPDLGHGDILFLSEPEIAVLRTACSSLHLIPSPSDWAIPVSVLRTFG